MPSAVREIRQARSAVAARRRPIAGTGYHPVPVLAIQFNATDSNRMREIGYLLILVAGILLAGGSAVPLAGRGGRSLAGLALVVAGALLFAALRWGSG